MNYFIKIIKSFYQINFVRQTVILQIGTGISILLSVLNSVVFARLLQPEKYGIYALIFSLSSLILLFMKPGTVQTVETLLSEAYAKKNELEIKAVIAYFLKLTIIISLTLGILGIYLAPTLSELLYQDTKIGLMARIVLLADIILVFFNLTAVVLQVLRRISSLTILENLNKLLKFLGGVILLLLGFGLWGVVAGYLAGIIFTIILSIIWYNRLTQDYNLPKFPQIINYLKNIKLKRYFIFGLKIMVSKNLSELFSLLPVLILGMFVSFQEVGFFKIAFSYASIPLMLLTPISRLLVVQLPASKVYGLKYLKTHFLKTSIYSGLISLVLIIPFILLAPFLVRFFYGQEYLPTVNLVYYLAAYSGLIGFGIGLGPVFRTLDKMNIVVIVNVLVLLVGLGVGYFMIDVLGAVGACLMLTLLYLSSNFILLFIAVKIINKQLQYERGNSFN